MPDILIIYYSRTGHTREMAESIARGVEQEGLSVAAKEAEKVDVDELLKVKGLIVGSPTYYGEAATQIRQIFDKSVKFHGKLDGKVGAAFTSAANIGGGNETTLLSILHSMLVHGMVVQGIPTGDHYGPVAVNAPDDRVRKQCGILGQRVAQLVRKLHP